jgi:hypothetical protein
MRKLKASALMIFGLSILFYLFFDYCKHAPTLVAANPFAEDPYDAVGSFGIQLAFVSALLGLVCVFRSSPPTGMPPTQILLALRSGAVVLLTVTVTLAADAIGLARAVITNGIFPAAAPLAGLLGGMALLTLTAGWTFIRAAHNAEVPTAQHPWGRAAIISGLAILILAFYPLSWRDSGLPGGIFTALAGMVLLLTAVWGLVTAIFPEIEFEYEDVFDDLSVIFRGWKKRFGHLATFLVWLEKATSIPLVRKFFGWFSPRKHRWTLVILAAVAMGLLLVVVEAVTEGISPNLGRGLMVVGVYVSLEGAGVVLGYLLFGKYLGFYRIE